MQTSTNQAITTSWKRNEIIGKNTLLMMLPTALEASVIRAIAKRILFLRNKVTSRMTARRTALAIKNTNQVSLSSKYDSRFCVIGFTSNIDPSAAGFDLSESYLIQE